MVNLIRTTKLFSIIAFFAFLVTACSESKAGNEAANTSAGASVFPITSVITSTDGTVADFTFMDNGKKVTFKEFTKGKVVFLNFWGTWCPPCRKEIPDIIEIYKEYKNKDFIVIGIALEKDQMTAINGVAKYANSNGINYTNFIGNKEIQNAYGGISAVPTTYLIGKDGKIAEKIVGMRSKADFVTSINRILK